MSSVSIEITIPESCPADLGPADIERFREGVARVLEMELVESAQIGVAVVDASSIHELNRRYLKHDWPTDVISFPLSEQLSILEGEIAVSADAALAQAEQYGWNPVDELLLYVVHGTLHLVGYDDATPESRDSMRSKEREVLSHFGLQPRYDDSVRPPASTLRAE